MSSQEGILNFVKIIVQSEIQTIYISPGSRNAPLIRAFLAQNKFQCHSVVDERSGAFMAMGSALAEKKPVALLCTSGTALVNYYPAIIEAFYAQIPLLIISADRPARLIDQWEGQCIRQVDIFEKHIGKSLSIDPEIIDEPSLSNLSKLMFDRLNAGLPVHVNIPLEEPLYVDEFEAITCDFKENIITTHNLHAPLDLKNDISIAEKILMVNGFSDNAFVIPESPMVTLNDIVSNKSGSPIHNWDGMFLSLSEEQKRSIEPDLLITTGTSIVSKSLRNWIRTIKPLKHWHIGNQNPLGDPFFTSPQNWPVNEIPALNSLAELVRNKPPHYLHQWKKLSNQYALTKESWNKTSWNELNLIDFMLRSMPKYSILHLANSSVVRYASWCGLQNEHLILHANRGASGIDGCTSTAVGYAKSTAKQVFLFTGDVAFFYDNNALWDEASIPSNLHIVLFNNQGGGIFELIQGPDKFPESLSFQTTKHKKNAQSICRNGGMYYDTAHEFDLFQEKWLSFCSIKNQASLLEIFTDQKENTKTFQELAQIRF